HRVRRARRPPPCPPGRRLHALPRLPGGSTDGRGAADLGGSGGPHLAGTPGNPHRDPHRPGRRTILAHPDPPPPRRLEKLMTTPPEVPCRNHNKHSQPWP